MYSSLQELRFGSWRHTYRIIHASKLLYQGADSSRVAAHRTRLHDCPSKEWADRPRIVDVNTHETSGVVSNLILSYEFQPLDTSKSHEISHSTRRREHFLSGIPDFVVAAAEKKM